MEMHFFKFNYGSIVHFWSAIDPLMFFLVNDEKTTK